MSDFPAKGLSCKVVGMFHNDDIIPATQEGMEACIILDKTCFYAEAGGQAADTGILLTDVRIVCFVWLIEIINC